ncbi:MAG: InlB B-repeat-containing protein, partial [Clostridiales bacterium]|nr:InlB B-repeat-containing protein [Clostridiales bacterium]
GDVAGDNAVGIIADGAKLVENVTVKNSTLRSAVNSTAAVAGGIVGRFVTAYLLVNPAVRNCVVLDTQVYASVGTSSYLGSAGGLIGQMSAANGYHYTVENCSVSNVTVQGRRSGGAIGHYDYNATNSSAPSVIQNISVADSNVYGAQAAGGVIGAWTEADNSTSGMTQYHAPLNLNSYGNAVANGNPSADAVSISGAGGVFGNVQSVNIHIQNCNNFSAVSGYVYVGGIVGVLRQNTLRGVTVSSTPATNRFWITDCYNGGAVTLNYGGSSSNPTRDNTAGGIAGAVSGVHYFGSIIDDATGHVRIANVMNAGGVSANDAGYSSSAEYCLGGIVGKNTLTRFSASSSGEIMMQNALSVGTVTAVTAGRPEVYVAPVYADISTPNINNLLRVYRTAGYSGPLTSAWTGTQRTETQIKATTFLSASGYNAFNGDAAWTLNPNNFPTTGFTRAYIQSIGAGAAAVVYPYPTLGTAVRTAVSGGDLLLGLYAPDTAYEKITLTRGTVIGGTGGLGNDALLAYKKITDGGEYDFTLQGCLSVLDLDIRELTLETVEPYYNTAVGGYTGYIGLFGGAGTETTVNIKGEENILVSNARDALSLSGGGDLILRGVTSDAAIAVASGGGYNAVSSDGDVRIENLGNPTTGAQYTYGLRFDTMIGNRNADIKAKNVYITESFVNFNGYLYTDETFNGSALTAATYAKYNVRLPAYASGTVLNITKSAVRFQTRAAVKTAYYRGVSFDGANTSAADTTSRVTLNGSTLASGGFNTAAAVITRDAVPLVRYTVRTYLMSTAGVYVMAGNSYAYAASGSTVTITDPGAPSGFLFDAEESILSGTNNGSLILRLCYERFPRELTFYLNGGTGGPTTPQTVLQGATVDLSAYAKPSKNKNAGENYTFTGWYASLTDANSGTNPISSFTVTGNYAFYAGWRDRAAASIDIVNPSYKTAYDVDEALEGAGATVDGLYISVLFDNGDMITSLGVQKSWVTGFTTAYETLPGQPRYATVTYPYGNNPTAAFGYAVTESAPQDFGVQYVGGASDVIGSGEANWYPYGAPITLPAGSVYFTRSGYDFIGWSDDQPYGGLHLAGSEFIGLSGMLSTLTARWRLSNPTNTGIGGTAAGTHVYTPSANPFLSVAPNHPLGQANVDFVYAWYKDGFPLSESGAMLILRNVADSGVYYCQITAVNNANDDASLPVSTLSVTVNITKAPQTVTMSQTTFTYAGNVIDLSDYAGGVGAGELSFAASNQSNVSVYLNSDGVLTPYTAGGTFTLTVTRAATDNYNAQTEAFTVALNKGAQSYTVSLDSDAPVVFGEYAVILTGSVSGTVYGFTPTNGGVGTATGIFNIGNNKLTISDRGASGTFTVRVQWAGDDLWTAVDKTQPFTFGKAEQAAVTFDEDGYTYEGVTLNLSLRAGGGSAGAFSFELNEESLDYASLTGAVLTVTEAGNYIGVWVTRAGDDNYNEQTVFGEFYIDKGTRSAVTLNVPSPNPKFGDVVTLSVAGGLTAVYTIVTDVTYTATGGITGGDKLAITQRGASGTIRIKATVAEDGLWNEATGFATFTFDKGEQSVLFNGGDALTLTYAGAAFNLASLVEGVGDGSIVWTKSGESGGVTVNLTESGNITVQAITQATGSTFLLGIAKQATQNYNAVAPVTYTVTVNKGTRSITLNTPLDNPTFGDIVTLSVAGGGTAAYSITGGTATGSIAGGNKLTITQRGLSGTIVITATLAEDGLYNEATDAKTITFNKATPQITPVYTAPDTLYTTGSLPALSFTSTNGATGTIAWDTPYTVKDGTWSYGWTFAGGDNFKDLNGSEEFTAVLDVITRIDITTNPTKMQYTAFQALDLTGLVVTGTRGGDGGTVVISHDQLVVSYTGETGSFRFGHTSVTLAFSNGQEKYTAVLSGVTVIKASYTGITHESFTGVYSPAAILGVSYSLSGGFAWVNPDTVPAAGTHAYAAVYNLDPDNYNDFELEITVTLSTASVEYTVTFNANGGSEVNPVTVGENGQIAAAPVTARAAYTFEGWYTDAGLTNKVGFPYTVTGNITLYAKWTPVSDGDPTDPNYGNPESDVLPGWAIALIAVGGVLVIGGAAAFVFLRLRAKKKSGAGKKK